MPSKDKKVISAKISENEFQVLEAYANMHNISISAIICLCVKGILDGDIEVEKGELKLGVNPIGYAVCDDLETSFGRRVDRKLDKLRERGYPETFIESLKEQMLSGLEAQIDMLPKKFDSRKMREEYA